MSKTDLPDHVYRYPDRHGRPRYRFQRRVNGRRVSKDLPDPWTDEFLDAYRAALAKTGGEAGRPRHPANSFAALVSAYLASPEFRSKAETTQYEYRRVLEKLATSKHGSKPVALMERRHVRRWRDERSDTPAAANTLVRTVRLLMSWAVENEWRNDNPAAGLKLFKTGEWRAWTDDELKAFEDRWPLGSMQRRAYALALYTGQRRSDLIAMQRQHRQDGGILVVQMKTEARLWIPEHPDLTATLAEGAPSAMMLLATKRGKAWQPQPFGAWCADAIEAAGLPDDCVWHGLRKTAARRMAESGCTVDEIRAILGHATAAMATHYVRQADQRRMASSAMLKLVQRTDEDR